ACTPGNSSNGAKKCSSDRRPPAMSRRSPALESALVILGSLILPALALPFSRLLPQRDRRQIQPQGLAPPPPPGAAARGQIRKSIFVQPRPEVARRFVGKRILFEQPSDLGLSLQQADAELNEPGIVPDIPQRGEPHLPIEPWLVRLDELGPVLQ